MTFHPGYGETPLPFDELDALLPDVCELLDDPITSAAVYDLEQAIEADLAEELITNVVARKLTLDQLLALGFLRDLHEWLYGRIWVWAGQHRRQVIRQDRVHPPAP